VALWASGRRGENRIAPCEATTAHPARSIGRDILRIEGTHWYGHTAFGKAATAFDNRRYLRLKIEAAGEVAPCVNW
jgi:hypothetical protein